MKVPRANKCHNLAVRNCSSLMYLLVSSKELPAASTIADEKFSIDQFMAHYFVAIKEPPQLG
jgi:hypothetical protein